MYGLRCEEQVFRRGLFLVQEVSPHLFVGVIDYQTERFRSRANPDRGN